MASSSREELHTSAAYHARSYSVESEMSSYFQLDRSQSSSEPSKPRLNWPPRLVGNGFPSRSAAPSPSRSVRSRSPESFYPLDELIPSADESPPNGGIERLAANGHAETEAISSRTSSMTSTLTVRKGSLDARPAKLQLTTSLDNVELPELRPPRPLFHSASNSLSRSVVSSPFVRMLRPEPAAHQTADLTIQLQHHPLQQRRSGLPLPWTRSAMHTSDDCLR